MRTIVIIVLGLVITLIVAGVGWSWWQARYRDPNAEPDSSILVSPPQNNADGTQSSDGMESTTSEPVEYRVEEFVSGLRVPWSIVFTSPDRVLVTERDGQVRVIQNGRLLEQPIKTFVVSTRSEEGLMGLTLHPEYENNNWVYVSYAYEKGGQVVDRVVRLTDTGSSLDDETTIIDDIPAANFHAGSRLRFGPDDKLYVTTGDATQRQLAQDQNSLAGKILRINDDGSVPEDNPFPGSPVWSLGHRNPQGLDWHPVTGTLYQTEHGPSGFDGPGGGDEVNVIEKGQNYGWPLVSHLNNSPGLVAPKIVFTPAVAPASGLFYTSDYLPQFTNTFLFGALRGEALYWVRVSDTDPTQVLAYDKVPGIEVGRIRDVAQGPDGMIYFSTSNRDGRGQAQTGDDKIYRLVRAE